MALCWLPLIGPFVAGYVGGRKARVGATASVAGAIPAALWGLMLWYVLGSREITVGKDTFTLAILLPLAPATALTLLGGALLGATGRGVRSLGAFLALGGLVLVGVRVNDVMAFFKPLMSKPAAPSPTAAAASGSCEQNLKDLYGAISLYAGSWDDCLPPADRWATAIADSSGKAELVRCPGAKAGTRGYAMNKALGGRKLSAMPKQGETPLIFDSDASGDSPTEDASAPAPAGRHGGRSYVLYADGTVKSR